MTTPYEASPIKRNRTTKAGVDQRCRALFDIVKAVKPMTVPQTANRRRRRVLA